MNLWIGYNDIVAKIHVSDELLLLFFIRWNCCSDSCVFEDLERSWITDSEIGVYGYTTGDKLPNFARLFYIPILDLIILGFYFFSTITSLSDIWTFHLKLRLGELLELACF